MPRARSGSDLIRAVARFGDRHRLLPAGPVVVALSGGPDSLLLLHLLADLAPKRGWRLVAAHLDHGLRPESAAEAAAVRALAAARGLPLRSERVEVAALAAEHGWSVEEAGRVARYRFLARVAAELGGAPVATGHTQDDQAETLLLRLARGTGLAGLRAMRPVTLLPPSVWHGAPEEAPLRVVRPLLSTGRAAIERELAARGLTPLRDPSNADPAYARNRLRHELLPAWEAIAPGVTERLAHMADIVAADEEVLERETERAWATLDVCEEISRAAAADGRAVTLNRRALLAQPLGLQRRLLRRAVGRCTAHAPTLAAVDLALAEVAKAGVGSASIVGVVQVVATGERVWIGAVEGGHLLTGELLSTAGGPGDAGQFGKGMLLTPSGDWVYMDPGPDMPPPAGPWMAAGGPIPLDLDGTTRLPGEKWSMTCRQIAPPACSEPLSGLHAHLVAHLAEAKPVVRTWRTGDRIALPGLGGRKKLSDLFIDRKVPRRHRWLVPLVVADDGTIAWVAGLAVGEPWRARGHEENVLCCTIVPVAQTADERGEGEG